MDFVSPRQRLFRASGACLATALVLALQGCTPAIRANMPTSTAQPSETSQAPSNWLEDVTAITGFHDSASRGQVIQQVLATANLQADAMTFEHKDLRGTNLIAPVPGNTGKPLLLLGAHYDQADIGDGVTDNAAGTAVVLELTRRFQQRPLLNHRVMAAFWDLEEKGLLGADAYVTGDGEKPALYVNFDVFGWGDTLWMMTPDPTHPLVAAGTMAAQAEGIALVSGTDYPPTDHLAFLKAGWPAVSYSLVDGDEIEPILRMFKREKLADPPKVMRVIHSPDDTVEQVDAMQVEVAIDAVEAALRAWDAGHGN